MSQPIQFNKRNVAYFALNAFGIFIIYLLKDFITPFLGAVIFFVLFQPIMNGLTTRFKISESLSAILIILLSFLIILVPTYVLSYMLYSKLTALTANPEQLLIFLNKLDEAVLQLTGKEIFTEEIITKIQTETGKLIPELLNKIFIILGHIGIMYFILYYMLVKRNQLNKEVNNYLPFELHNIQLLAEELRSQTLSNSIGVPLIATIQGTAAGLGYWLFGVPEPLFWGIITGFASIIPLAGSTLVWAPAALFLIFTGELWFGLGLLAYGAIVIINIDNVARFIIQKQFADVHPIITVFGVIIGLNLFGLPGLIFGPLMLSYFIIFIKMYRAQYAAKS